jgi:hypothetical protein
MKNKREESYDEDNDDINNYYDDELEEDSDRSDTYDKFGKLEKEVSKAKNEKIDKNIKSEIANKMSSTNKKAAVHHYKDQPYDLAYEINESVEESGVDQAKDLKKLNEDTEEDEEDENKIETKVKGINDNIHGGSNLYTGINSTKPLPKFDFNEFYNLDAGEDVKDLMKVMKKY